jgi:hypothetical protein
MKHLEFAKSTLTKEQQKFVSLKILPGDTARMLTATIQGKPVGDVGVTGIQATDLLLFVRGLFQSLNSEFPCQENVDTIESISVGILHQHSRTFNRVWAGVEGKSEAIPSKSLEEANKQEALDKKYSPLNIEVDATVIGTTQKSEGNKKKSVAAKSAKKLAKNIVEELSGVIDEIKNKD